MTEAKLKDWLSEPGMTQELAAKAMGITQGAITQMLKAKRDIRIVLEESSKFVRAYEVKKVGNKVA